MTPEPLVLRLMTYRKQLGWSLDELSAKSGISKTALSEVGNGHHRPRIDTVIAIADAMRLDVQLVERPDHRCGNVGPFAGWVCNRGAGHTMPHIQFLGGIDQNIWEPSDDADGGAS